MDETGVAFLRAKYEWSILQNNKTGFVDFFVAYLIEQLENLLKEKLNMSQSRTHE